MSKITDLGEATAYALAVKYGYEGTEEEWVAEMESKRLDAKRYAEAAGASASDAQASGQEALEAKESAELSVQSSADNALLSESFAHGGTGSRTGEDTDNSAYYCRMAEEHLDSVERTARTAMGDIQNALNLAKPQFLFNPENGCLYCRGGRFEFALDENKNLRWRITL